MNQKLRIFSRFNFLKFTTVSSPYHGIIQSIQFKPININLPYSSHLNIHRLFSTPVTTPLTVTSEKNPNQTTKIKIRPLPEISSKTPRYIAYGIIGISIWATAIALSFNHQRVNSSSVKESLFNVKHHPKAIQHLGRNINFTAPQWWPFPSQRKFPWISGNINQLKGVVDFKYWEKAL
ncbi:14877_t:CDS:2 [Racocetra persica]|uniref:14877_t:CDS:1 n=1 Tax=Racocetra persica TaxID=160502 RepID=A0ACA9P6E8_9GLOM|nr:14877_t:CDS:2 [Racocetra persica]